jgi:hypothetical protein
MPKADFQEGSSTVEGFFGYMNERFLIHQRRERAPMDPPWTDDPILQRYSFTNVFREWDRGTLALHYALRQIPGWDDAYFYRGGHPRIPWYTDCIAIARATVIYRLWNLADHATEYGPVLDLEDFIEYIRRRRRASKTVFTSAYLTTSMGQAGIDKAELYIDACRELWNGIDQSTIEFLQRERSLKETWESLQQFLCVGGFVAQELVQDWRHIGGLLWNATDTNSWSHPGPGAHRGLRRLGYPTGREAGVESMVRLWKESVHYLAPDLKRHHPEIYMGGNNWEYPPLDVHVIEFCLCEFDKYERVRLGQGKPRKLFRNG